MSESLNWNELDLSDKVVVFTTQGCQYCARLVKILETLKLPFEEIKISSYPVGFIAVDHMMRLGGTLSLPRLFANSVCLGVCYSRIVDHLILFARVIKMLWI
jgi:glutaredoxin